MIYIYTGCSIKKKANWRNSPFFYGTFGHLLNRYFLEGFSMIFRYFHISQPLVTPEVTISLRHYAVVHTLLVSGKFKLLLKSRFPIVLVLWLSEKNLTWNTNYTAPILLAGIYCTIDLIYRTTDVSIKIRCAHNWLLVICRPVYTTRGCVRDT